MMNKKLRTAAALIFLGTGVPAVAQPPVQPVQQPPVTERTTAAPSYRAKQVLGSKVMIEGNTSIGVVDDLVFDAAGNMDFLIVNNGGKLTTLPWEAAKFNFEQQVATVAITAEQYKTIPTYTTTTYPNFYTPTYRTEVYKYYNLTPRELRRWERGVRR